MSDLGLIQDGESALVFVVVDGDPCFFLSVLGGPQSISEWKQPTQNNRFLNSKEMNFASTQSFSIVLRYFKNLWIR